MRVPGEYRPSAEADKEVNVEAERYVVLRAPVEGRGAGTRGRGVGIDEPMPMDVETHEISHKKEIRELDADPEVASFAPVLPLKLHEPTERDVETEAETERTWGVEAVRAHDSPYDGRGVTVAILDTGIDGAHVAFQGVMLVENDFTGEGNGDGDGHGTHCAGTVFGREVEGLRIGIAPGIEKALIGKVLGAGGGGSTDGIASAIQWALDEGANVISLSLGIDFPGQVKNLVASGFPADLATSKALEGYRANVSLFGSLAELARTRSALLNQATVVVAASGNESRRDETPSHEIAASPPAAAEGIFAIAAVGQSAAGFMVAPFSNTAADIAGPGVAIRSAKAHGGLTVMSGTSMATPHVAGVAALWVQQLIRTTGRVDNTALAAKLIASGRQDALAAGFDSRDVGTGLAQAPAAG